MPRSILCPVDFGPASLSAVEFAISEAKLRDATLHLLHVWQPGVGYAGEGPPIPFAAELPKEAIEADLAALNTDLPPNRIAMHVTDGKPADDIVDMAIKLESDLVVMGTHARRGLSRWIIGSTCDSVLRACPCPVLICRGPEQDADASTRSTLSSTLDPTLDPTLGQ